MKPVLLAALLSSCFAIFASAAPLKLMCWNAEWFPGRKTFANSAEMVAHIKACQAVIAAENPDLLVAQEIRDWHGFATLCEPDPALKPAVVSAFRDQETGELWPQQIAVASKVPVEAAWAEPWTPAPADLPRGFSLAAIKMPAPERGVLLVYGVHLKSNRGDDKREEEANTRLRNESANQLVQHIALMERLVFKDRVRGVIVAGDFNTNQDGQFPDHALEILGKAGLTNAWGDTPREQRQSWRGNDKFPPTTFDHILVKGVKTSVAKLLPVAEDTSDHWPVIVTIEMPETP